jgi:hypothetical protein
LTVPITEVIASQHCVAAEGAAVIAAAGCDITMYAALPPYAAFPLPLTQTRTCQ